MSQVVKTLEFIDGDVKVFADVLDSGCVRFTAMPKDAGHFRRDLPDAPASHFGLGADVLAQLALAAARAERR